MLKSPYTEPQTFCRALGAKPSVSAPSGGAPNPYILNQDISKWQFSALGKWGRTQMGSDGFNRILTGFYFFSPAGVRLVPLKTRDFKGFHRILTGF